VITIISARSESFVVFFDRKLADAAWAVLTVKEK